MILIKYRISAHYSSLFIKELCCLINILILHSLTSKTLLTLADVPMMRLHNIFLYLLLLVLLTAERPNLVIFLVDDLGWGDLGYTGHPTTASPHLDHLARNGKVLTQFYAGGPLCTPSRAALLTGN